VTTNGQLVIFLVNGNRNGNDFFTEMESKNGNELE